MPLNYSADNHEITVPLTTSFDEWVQNINAHRIDPNTFMETKDFSGMQCIGCITDFYAIQYLSTAINGYISTPFGKINGVDFEVRPTQRVTDLKSFREQLLLTDELVLLYTCAYLHGIDYSSDDVKITSEWCIRYATVRL